ncbi:hypothetical protein A4X06_0g3092 [Tilletia controversa]|uniref:Tc1-like transposase DDE domain-containing protein n=1 Tax=Tilletia controversa TaxID=13291 RepID=A0A8X7MV36_9BASI|nr:hypothetical protein A4X06_0g3092 [Tilletia controversa]
MLTTTIVRTHKQLSITSLAHHHRPQTASHITAPIVALCSVSSVALTTTDRVTIDIHTSSSAGTAKRNQHTSAPCAWHSDITANNYRRSSSASPSRAHQCLVLGCTRSVRGTHQQHQRQQQQHRAWLAQHSLTVLDWPAQSPDLNPIEQVWRKLKEQLKTYSTPAANLQQLKDRIQEQWDLIPADYIQRLVASMPARVEAVIKAKGRNTKY